MQKLTYLLLLTTMQGMAQNVGIGTNDPAYLLEVAGSLRSGAFHPNPGSKIMYVIGQVGSGAALDGGVEFRHSNGTQGIGFGFNTIYATGANASQPLGLAARGPEGNLQFSTNGVERMHITGAGNVGIGTPSPNAQLQLANNEANRKLVLFEAANNNHQFFGFGINNSVLRYQVASTASSHIFYAGESANASNELLRIRGNGNLVISGMIESEGFIPFDSGIFGQQITFDQFDNQAGYRKDKTGMVYLRGRFTLKGPINSPSNYSIFELPEEYKAQKFHYFPVVAEWGLTYLTIIGNQLSVWVPAGNAAKWVNLDGVAFRQGL